MSLLIRLPSNWQKLTLKQFMHSFVTQRLFNSRMKERQFRSSFKTVAVQKVFTVLVHTMDLTKDSTTCGILPPVWVLPV